MDWDWMDGMVIIGQWSSWVPNNKYECAMRLRTFVLGVEGRGHLLAHTQLSNYQTITSLLSCREILISGRAENLG